MKYPDHLVFVTDDDPGYSRKRHGKGFIFLDEHSKKIKDKRIIEFIRQMVIPPMWNNVWISPRENGYLLSTGFDDKRRKQYLYHSDWSTYRQHEKFSEIVHFGEILPSLRADYTEDLKEKKWTKNKVTALVINLMDNYYFRVGNNYYSSHNKSYGVTTLRRRHIDEEARGLSFSYKAKSGKYRKIKIDNLRTARLVKQISELPGYEVFRYHDKGSWHNINSADVNAYLKTKMGADFTAKNFRTWGASKTAIEMYEETINTVKENPRLKFETTLVKKVAKVMGNTVSVCRKYYIHPELLRQLTLNKFKPLSEIFAMPNSSDVELDRYENLLLNFLKMKDVRNS